MIEVYNNVESSGKVNSVNRLSCQESTAAVIQPNNWSRIVGLASDRRCYAQILLCPAQILLMFPDWCCHQFQLV